MPRNRPKIYRPVEISRLRPVAPAAEEAVLLRERVSAVSGIFVGGLALIILGTFKPLAVYFSRAFPWIVVTLGSLLCISALDACFKWRQIMDKSDEKKLAYVFGVVFVTVVVIAALFVPNPTDFQYTVFRIVLALAAGGVASMIPGFLAVTWPTGVRAGGALGVFVVVFFFAPAALQKLHG